MAFNGKYDPKTLDDLVIDPNNKRVLEMIVAGRLQDHLLLEGTNGTAKSTIANLLPKLKHGEDYEIAHVKAYEGFVIDQKLLDKWINIHGWCRGNQDATYIVIDEIDTLDKNHSLFWQWLDQWRDRITVIGTTNKLMAVPRAMRSRMNCLTFRPVKAIDMLPRAKVIMQSEGITIDDAALLAELVAIVSLGDIRKYMHQLERLVHDFRSVALVSKAPAIPTTKPIIKRVK
jgi:replication-associated recombination protein RarA